MKIVENNYKSFFALKKKGEKDAEIPKYLKKNGRFPVYFTYSSEFESILSSKEWMSDVNNERL